MSSDRPVRIGVVAATHLRLLGLMGILEDSPGAEVISLELDAAYEAENVDLLLLDFHASQASIETIVYVVARLREAKPNPRILVMAALLSMEDVQTLVGAGAKGYLPDNASEKEIHLAVEVILDGSIWGPRKVLARLIEAKTSRPAPSPPMRDSLTDRELEVLNLLTSGRSNREIAAVLGVEETTVKAHMGRMLHKTRANNRVQLSLRALNEKPSQNRT